MKLCISILAIASLAFGKVAAQGACPDLSVADAITIPSCNGASDGIIELEITGGDGIYEVRWLDGARGAIRSGLAAGQYEATISSCTGADEVTTSVSVYLYEPDALTGPGIVDDVPCGASVGGSIDLQPQGGGGSGVYTYVWNGPSATTDFQDQYNLVEGVYSVDISDDNGCTGSAAFTVGAATALTLRATTVEPTGGGGGSIDLRVSGGTGSYTYAWTGPGVNAMSEDQSGLGYGEYSVSVQDGGSCAGTATYTLAPPVGELVVGTTAEASCPDASTGAIATSVSGGRPPYAYTWTGGLAATASPQGVPAGTYTVTVTDQDGTEAQETVAVDEHPELLLTAEVRPASQSANGAIDLTPTGGFGGEVRFDWSNGATTEDIDDLAPADYTVRALDVETGCSYSATYTVPQVDTALALVSDLATTSCNSANGGECDAAYTVTVSGGTAPYEVAFVGGSSVGLPASRSFAEAGSASYTDLCPGDFDVEVVDANGVRFSESGLVLAEPSPVEIQRSIVSPVTFSGGDDGGVNITPVGGTAPYTFAWSGGPDPAREDLVSVPTGDYRVEITDARGCGLRSRNYTVQRMEVRSATVSDVTCADDPAGAITLETTGTNGPLEFEWSNGDSTRDLTNVPAGTYSVTITDLPSGANIEESYTVRAQSYLNLTAAASSDYLGSAISCVGAEDGTLRATAADGVGEVTYRWNTGDTSAELTDLGAGRYSVTATDALGCRVKTNVELTDPEPLTAEIDATNARCAGEENGRLSATVRGGAGGYAYLWSTGSERRAAARLREGNYTLDVVDGNGCEMTFNAGVQEPVPLRLTTEATPDNGDVGGTATVGATGGTPPYTYAWSGQSETSSTLTDVPAGTYTVLVVDDNGCDPASASVVVRSGEYACLQATEVLTPSLEDGVNDYLAIDCIDQFPGNSVEVFDRYGQSIFSVSGYDNRGAAFAGRGRGGELLAEGPYYYVITYDDADGQRRQRRGSLTLLR